MEALRIRSVEVAEDGLIVQYEDASCAFYHESVVQTHLGARQAASVARQQGKSVRKPVGSVRPDQATMLRWRRRNEPKA